MVLTSGVFAENALYGNGRESLYTQVEKSFALKSEGFSFRCDVGSVVHLRFSSETVRRFGRIRTRFTVKRFFQAGC